MAWDDIFSHLFVFTCLLINKWIFTKYWRYSNGFRTYVNITYPKVLKDFITADSDNFDIEFHENWLIDNLLEQ